MSSGCTVLLIVKKIYKIIIIVKLDLATMTKGTSSGSDHCILSLSRTSQYPPPAIGDFYAPRRNSFSSNIGRIMWFFVSCSKGALWESFTWRTGCVLLISEKRECVAEGRVVMSSHLGKGQRCEQQSGQVSSPYLVEAAAERAIMSSRSGGISGRATGN